MRQLWGPLPTVHFGKEAGLFGSTRLDTTSSKSRSLHCSGHVGHSTAEQYFCILSSSSLGLHDNIIVLTTNVFNLCAILLKNKSISLNINNEHFQLNYENCFLHVCAHEFVNNYFGFVYMSCLTIFKCHIFTFQ